MSEYQYYEFQAIDRPLTGKEMEELRSYSTRARITPTSFVNDYSWGDFKGNEDAWMEKYFDAFLYLANWGTHVLKLRLPARLLDAKTARSTALASTPRLREKNGKVILTFQSPRTRKAGDWIEGDGHLCVADQRAGGPRPAATAALSTWAGSCARRAAISMTMTSSHRCPLVSPSSAPRSRVSSSSSGSTPISSRSQPRPARPRRHRAEAQAVSGTGWLGYPSREGRPLSTMIAGDTALASELVQRIRRERGDDDRGGAPSKRRTVAELLRAAEHAAEERRRVEAEQAARKAARREREAAAARIKHLDKLAGTEPALWKRVEELIATKQPKRYDEAIGLLADLRDLAARKDGADFRRRLEALRAEHARKPTLIERLRKVAL